MQEQSLSEQTIRDFGEQWSRFTDNEGYYGSSVMLDDHFGALIDLERLRGARVADIGAGTGRFVLSLLAKGVAHVFAVEPSAAMDALVRNTDGHRDRITYLRHTGDQLPAHLNLDFIFSIGVLHHVPDPDPVVSAAYEALRPGGHLCVWLYGHEGNETYLAIFKPVRRLVKSSPHWVLNALTWALYFPTALYIRLCHWFKLPMHQYATGLLGRFSPSKVRLVIYDQLNPAYAKYYRRAEAVALLERGGFKDVEVFHRHGYSWSVRGKKP